MYLQFKQKALSMWGAYDIYDENGEMVFHVDGQWAVTHLLKIYNAYGEELGAMRWHKRVVHPYYQLYEMGQHIGAIRKLRIFGRNDYVIPELGWKVEGVWTGLDYTILDEQEEVIATVRKELFQLTDTYHLEITNENDALFVVMFVLAIDAEKASKH